MRKPFLYVTGGALSGAASLMGVKLVNEGLKMLKLFLLLRSDILRTQRRLAEYAFSASSDLHHLYISSG